jgi:GT2 family glycosyltransferase
VDQLIGAFFVVRRSLFESLGGFDERFFVYYEEVDFSWRARQAGYSSVYLPGVHALHHGEASSGQVKGRRLFYLLRSRALYARKH